MKSLHEHDPDSAGFRYPTNPHYADGEREVYFRLQGTYERHSHTWDRESKLAWLALIKGSFLGKHGKGVASHRVSKGLTARTLTWAHVVYLREVFGEDAFRSPKMREIFFTRFPTANQDSYDFPKDDGPGADVHGLAESLELRPSRLPTGNNGHRAPQYASSIQQNAVPYSSKEYSIFDTVKLPIKREVDEARAADSLADSMSLTGPLLPGHIPAHISIEDDDTYPKVCPSNTQPFLRPQVKNEPQYGSWPPNTTGRQPLFGRQTPFSSQINPIFGAPAPLQFDFTQSLSQARPSKRVKRDPVMERSERSPTMREDGTTQLLNQRVAALEQKLASQERRLAAQRREITILRGRDLESRQAMERLEYWISLQQQRRECSADEEGFGKTMIGGIS